MAVKEVVTLGIGASPGSLKYFLTLGLWRIDAPYGPLQGALSELAAHEGTLSELTAHAGALAELHACRGALAEVL